MQKTLDHNFRYWKMYNIFKICFFLLFLYSCDARIKNQVKSVWVSERKMSLYFTEKTITILKNGDFIGEYIFKKNDSLLILSLPFDSTINFQVSYKKKSDMITVFNDQSFVFGFDTFIFQRKPLDSMCYSSVLSHKGNGKEQIVNLFGSWTNDSKYIVFSQNGKVVIGNIGYPLYQSEVMKYHVDGSVIFFQTNRYKYYYSVIESIDDANLVMVFNKFNLKYLNKVSFVKCPKTDIQNSDIIDTNTMFHCQ